MVKFCKKKLNGAKNLKSLMLLGSMKKQVDKEIKTKDNEEIGQMTIKYINLMRIEM
jgi:hypothetical protein